MATKKSTRPPVKMKMLDFTKDKTSAPVKKAVHQVDMLFRQQVHDANIPALRVLEKIINVDSFFLNHLDFEAILGSNIDLLDRMMMTAICSVLTKDIQESIADAKLNYVGVWDEHTIYSIAGATVTFMKHDTKTETYLTALQFEKISQEDLDKFPTASYMPFSEYNPNRFFQQMINIRAVVLNTISGIIQHKIPKAFLASDEQPLSLRLVNYYQSIMQNDMKTIVSECKYVTVPEDNPLYGTFSEQPATEKLVRRITDYFEKPFMSFIALILQESGLSQNIINMMLGMSRLHLIYEDPVDKILGDVGVTVMLTTERSGLSKPTKVEYHTTIRDMTDMALLNMTNLSKSRWDTYGKPIRTFILDLCTYAINIYCDTMEMNKPKETPVAYINESAEAAPASDDVQDMDIEEMTKLLGGDTAATEI